MSTSHPILFTGEMVRSILDGRKTQTRRVIVCRRDVVSWSVGERDDGSPWPGYEDRDGDWQWMGSPFGEPGNTLWVRETWGLELTRAWRDAPAGTCLTGQADLLYRDKVPMRVIYRADGDQSGIMWRPSIHMPRRASRINLKVNATRVEYVQEISAADVTAEGTPGMIGGRYGCHTCNNAGWTFAHPGGCPDCSGTGEHPQGHFRKLWDSINAKRGYGWDTNPWVWVVEFERTT